MKINETALFVIVTFISSLAQITADLYLPSIPAIAQDIHANINDVQFSISLYVVGLAVSPLIYGPVSDGIGRRKPLLFGSTICLIGGVICLFSEHIYVLNSGRLLQGLGAGAGATLIRPILRDLFSGEKLAKYGSYSALIGVGVLATAPLLGGYFQQYLGWRFSFAFLTFLSLISLLLVIFLVPETNQYLHTENLRFRTLKNNVTTLIKSPVFMGYSFCWLSTYGAILAWLTAGPVVLEKVVGISPVAFGWAYFFTGVAFAIGAIINAKYVTRLGIHRMLQFGLSCILVAGLAMLFSKILGFINTGVILGPAVLVLFGAPLIFPNTFAGAFQPFPKISGVAGALFESIGRLGGAIGSSLLAVSNNQNQLPMAYAFIISALLSWFFYYSLCRGK